jgi:hypothetical protein
VDWKRLAENCLPNPFNRRLVVVVGKPRLQRWTEKQVGRREQVQVLADQVVFLDRPEPEEEQEV